MFISNSVENYLAIFKSVENHLKKCHCLKRTNLFKNILEKLKKTAFLLRSIFRIILLRVKCQNALETGGPHNNDLIFLIKYKISK